MMQNTSEKRGPGRPRKFADSDRAETAGSPTVDKPPAPEWKKFSDPSGWDGEFANPNDNPLNLGVELCEHYAREGIEFLWAAETVMGQPQDMSHHFKNGFKYVEEGVFPDIPIVKHDGCVLLARAKSIGDQARAAQEREARLPLEVAKQRAGQGDLPGIPAEAARHSSARNFNHMRSHLERLDVPKD
jgi:hypothetical protein